MVCVGDERLPRVNNYTQPSELGIVNSIIKQQRTQEADKRFPILKDKEDERGEFLKGNLIVHYAGNRREQRHCDAHFVDKGPQRHEAASRLELTVSVG